ncbi:hypothetical protein [Tumebacillus flagellatus]|uniref:hypothetical protein n=1 Tax=Tumebacillus flagellatus TaxID=1157490 RepID=UPI001377D341|nr:hypothetical protein [Tumebacillus flagellatus]
MKFYELVKVDPRATGVNRVYHATVLLVWIDIWFEKNTGKLPPRPFPPAKQKQEVVTA